MEIKDLEKAGDLLSEYKTKLTFIQRVLNVTDPKFRPISAKLSDDGEELIISSESGDIKRRRIQVYIMFLENVGINTKTAKSYDLRIGLLWIEQEIEKLNKIQKQIDEL